MNHLRSARFRAVPLDQAPRAPWLALAAGLAIACATFAQDSQPSQGEEQPGADERGRDMAGERPEPPAAPPPAAQPSGGDSPLRRAWSQMRGGQGEQANQPVDPAEAPRRLEIPADPAAAEAPAELVPPDPEDVFTIETVGEPVQIGSLVDWVSKRLNINIFSDPGVADRTITFNGPMQIKAAELLDFLSLLVEQQGFALTREREGWYVIRPAGQVAFNLGEGELATTRIIPTPLMRPTALKVAVDAALASRGAADGTAANRIAYIDELGIIIITDTPRGLRSVEEIVKAVIAEARSQTFHRIEVVHLNAELARNKVIELNGAQATSRQTQRGNNQPIGQNAVVTPATGSLTNLPDRIFLDSESNALIFRGTASEASELATLVLAIDNPSKLIPKRYPAGPASPAICSYGERRGLGPVTSGPSTGGSQFSQSGSFGNRGNAGLNNQQMQGTGAGSGFVLEDNQEAFVYFGTAEQHEQVEALVESFADQARLARVVVEFYPLKHADAEEVGELLNAIVQDTSQQFGDSPFLPQPGGARRVTQTAPTEEGGETTTTTIEGDGVGVSLTPSQDLSIQADVARNQIVIKAPMRQQAEFASIIAQLDIRQPQVFIEAKIVSVITNDDFEFGVDWQAAIDTSVGTINMFSNFGLINAIPTPAGAGPTAIGVVNGTDVDVVLNALAAVGETRILSTPRILVRDNGEAELNSTQERPYASTTQNAGTAVTSQGGTVEAGTKLTVSPQISSGGLVNLELVVELSDFIGEGADGLQPPKQKEIYETNVSLPSDSTLIIGGLTFDRKSDDIEKVPLLGDIPIIGQAFRNTVTGRQRTTVFVFIRPVILRDESMTDLRLLTKGPLKESGIEGDTPELQPERIPIRSGSLGSSLDRPARLSREDKDPS